jgi:hypothetical protein
MIRETVVAWRGGREENVSKAAKFSSSGKKGAVVVWYGFYWKRKLK